MNDLHPIIERCAACGKEEAFDDIDLEFSSRIFPALRDVDQAQRQWVCKACTRKRFTVGNAVIQQRHYGNLLVRLFCWWIGVPK